MLRQTIPTPPRGESGAPKNCRGSQETHGFFVGTYTHPEVDVKKNPHNTGVNFEKSISYLLQDDSIQCHLVITNISIENGPVEIVDLPIQNGEFFQFTNF